ncbi:MAG TPA: hypothetical protein VFS89_03760 [Nitrosospira sp.]|nr:hypothetical protein [Nitrosospira sp.]
MARGLAAGLAEGIQNGMNIGLQSRQMERLEKSDERLAKADERDAELHELRKDQYASEKEVRDRRNNALKQIAEYTTAAMGGGQQAQPQAAQGPSLVQDPNASGFNAPPEQQTPSASVKLAGPIPQGGLSMNAPSAPFAADNPAGALASSAPQGAQQPQQATPPGKVLERGMVTGMYTPKMLTDIAGIFAQNGLHEEGVKYMNQAYTAQKQGAVRASMALLQNNPGGAAEALTAGGMELDGLPVKVKPDDPNDPNWKLNIKGQGEKTINVRDLMQSTMDPDKFFELEDRRRKESREASMDERKQANVERKTNAEIGFLKSRGTLAEAMAAGGVGGLRPSRSSEAQINTAISRRDKAFDRVSMVKGEFGEKAEIDPMKRQEFDSAANQYMTFLEDQLGEELDARQHHKFTDVMLSYPVGGSPEQIKKWQQTEFLPRFGGRRAAKEESPQQRQAGPANTPAQSQGLAPAAPATKPKGGTLAELNQRRQASQALSNEMASIQQALKAPNLDVNQKAALSLKAQEIATRRDALK